MTRDRPSGPADLSRIAGRLWRAARNRDRTREQWDVWRDQRRFESRYGTMLRSVRADPGGPRALLVSLSDWPHQLKMEGVLAKGLELRGFVPVVLTLPTARWAHRYFRTFGVDRFVYPEQFKQVALDPEIEHITRELLAGEISVQALKRLTYRGTQVGIQTLSSLSRGFQQGRISLADPEVLAALARLLPEALRSVGEAEALLDDVRPELVLFLEKGYAGFGSIYDVAVDRGINVIQYVNAGIHWRDALILKRYTAETRRVHPASLSDETWMRVQTLPWTAERERELDAEFDLRYGAGEKHPDAGLQEGKRIKTPDEVRAQLGLREGRKVAVVFSHVLWDANMFFGEDLFEDMETWLVETVRAAAANSELDWIIKLHPANMYKAEKGRELNDQVAIREAIGSLPSHVHLLEPETDINTFSLFSVADVGITIRGTIGLELPCFGVPMVTAGTGRYSGRGFTVDSPDATSYLDLLARLHELPPLTQEQTTLAKRHAYGLFRLRPFRVTSFENTYAAPERLGHPLGHNLDLTIRTARELHDADDLNRFGEWAVDREQLDYVDWSA